MNQTLSYAKFKTTLIGLCIALGIGLLIGAERERRKDNSPVHSAAGIRTFAVVALMGAVSFLLAGVELFGLVVLVVGAGVMMAYQKSSDQDAGLTTEFALVMTCILGGLAMNSGLLAAGVGVIMAMLLAARSRMHHFVSTVLTEQDLKDTLKFFTIALIAMPLTPDRFMGPFNALNPRAITTLIVAVMAVSALGYVGMRWMGLQKGLPLAGFATGIVSSAATIHAMGKRVRQDKTIMAPAVAGAVLSSIATMIQMSVVIALVQPDLLLAMAWPLASGGVAATGYGLFFYLKIFNDQPCCDVTDSGRAFDLKTSVGFALLLTLVMVASAGLNTWWGDAGILISAAVSGFADAHAAAASAASLMTTGKIDAKHAMVSILLGLTTNTLTKAILAFNAGGVVYASKILPGLLLMVSATWLGFGLIS